MRTVVVLSLLSLAIGCKGKPKHQEPPTNLVTPGSGSAKGSGGEKAAPDIQLPRGNGSPPVKTTAAVDSATLDKLQAMTFKGFEVKPHGRTPYMMEVRQITEDHPRIWATVTIGACAKEGLGECPAMTLDTWKAKSKELKATLMAEELRDLPDTVFEIGTTTINGAMFIYQYQLAQSSMAPQQPPTAGSGSAAKAPAYNPGHLAFSHAYTLYYNDGHNQLRVVAEYKDDATESKEAMAKLVPKQDLEAVAKAFADVYTQAW